VQDIVSASDQKVVLPFVGGQAGAAGQRRILVSDCSGKKRLATRTGSILTVADAAGVGWVRTVGEPTVFAGVNLPVGETDMTTPAEADVDDALSRVFSIVDDTSVAVAGGMRPKKQMPLWRALACVLIAMLLLESTVTNRLRR
jgi:hypothetical protein